MECSICGISGQLRNVSQALAPKGIVLVCDRCAMQEGFPVLKKPRVTEESARETMYERMARIAGVKPREPERPWRAQEKSLREIVDRNYEKKIRQEAIVLKPRPDLVDNFHWIIMRIRRVKGLTQKQLAELIQEPEAAIKMAEQGVVPEGYGLIDKLERFLKVRLIRERAIFPQEKKQGKALVFDKQILDSLTIDDLRRMKKEAKTEPASEEKEINEEDEEEKKEKDSLQARNYDRLDYE